MLHGLRAFPIRRWLLLSLVLHLLAAWFSVGFYDLDEHFQTLEFLSHHLGWATAADLPWEFSAQQRPWIQPLLYAAIAKGWMFFGVTRPAWWAASFRAVSALLGWLATSILSVGVFSWFDNDRARKMTLWLLALLWFLPYFHARTSSESFSSSLFFIGAGLLALGLESGSLSFGWGGVVGFLLGLAGYARYQIGPMHVGLLLWCVFVARVKMRGMLAMGFGAFLAMAVGLAADRIGYGFWTFSPWNHLYVNVIQGYAAQQFGAQSWWFYLYFVGEYLAILSGAVGLAVILGWLIRPWHWLTWVTLPFFLALCGVEHKELRFLFPMMTAVPVLIGFTLDWFSRHLPRIRVISGLGWLFFSFNLAVLLVATLKPSSSQPLLYDYVYRKWPELNELHYLVSDPFNVAGGKVRFYRHPGVREVKEPGWGGLTQTLSARKSALWLFYEYYELPVEAGPLRGVCQFEFSVFPEWLKAFRFIPGIRNSASQWSIFRCESGRG